MARRILARVDGRALARDVASAAGLGFFGDLVCQCLIEDRRLPGNGGVVRWRHADSPPVGEHEFDPRRLCSLTAFGSMYLGGFLHFLYQTYPGVVMSIARRVPVPAAGQMLRADTAAHALGCACLDNVHNGLIYIPAYFFGVGLLQGSSLVEARSNLGAEWLTTYVTCSAFWLPFMWGTFALVPPARRVQAVACANLAWNVVIDHLAHRGQHGQEAEERHRQEAGGDEGVQHAALLRS